MTISTDVEIERKFLVREASLKAAENITLTEIESVYLNHSKISTLGVNHGLTLQDSEAPLERRVTKRETDSIVKYFLTLKLGGQTLSRVESEIEIDEQAYKYMGDNFGESVVNKKRFTFDYANNTFELDVFPDVRLLLMEIELSDEKQLFELPPFVRIVRDVTGDKRFYSSNLGQPLTT